MTLIRTNFTHYLMAFLANFLNEPYFKIKHTRLPLIDRFLPII